MSMLRQLARRGFVGPKFEGLLGRARFFWQELVWRRDLILVVTPATATPLAAVDPALRLEQVTDFAALAAAAPMLDAEYYDGFTAKWRGPLSWGETLNLLWDGPRPVAFLWHRFGTPEGVHFYAGTLLEGDCRTSRSGVVPSGRRKGYMKALKTLANQRLFEAGAKRIYVEVDRDNIPSLKANYAVGFRPVAEITVLGPWLRGFIRWGPPPRPIT